MAAGAAGAEGGHDWAFQMTFVTFLGVSEEVLLGLMELSVIRAPSFASQCLRPKPYPELQWAAHSPMVPRLRCFAGDPPDSTDYLAL